MARLNLKKNDLVIVIQGKDKGKTGKILRMIPDKRRIVVEGVNLRKHFVRADRSRNIQGGVMEKEAALDISKVQLFCPDCGQGTRPRSRTLEDGTKIRVCHRCGNRIEAQK